MVVPRCCWLCSWRAYHGKVASFSFFSACCLGILATGRSRQSQHEPPHEHSDIHRKSRNDEGTCVKGDDQGRPAYPSAAGLKPIVGRIGTSKGFLLMGGSGCRQSRSFGWTVTATRDPGTSR